MEGVRLEKHVKGQQKMTSMLAVFDSICKKHNIKYWCDGGTFIGATRHEGWIPYDGDIDVGMLYQDYYLFKTKLSERPNTMWLQTPQSDKTYRHWYMPKLRDLHSSYLKKNNTGNHGGLQIDIFLFELKGNLVEPILKRNPKKPSPLGESYRIFDYNTIFPLRKGKFETIEVYLPNDIKQYSLDVWGSYPLPLLPVNQRFPKEGPMDPDAPLPQTLIKYKHLYETPTVFLKA
jgi:phosphorylcholine metabolism protein LicD